MPQITGPAAQEHAELAGQTTLPIGSRMAFNPAAFVAIAPPGAALA